MNMHVRLARVEDRAQMLTLWERSVRATHHFLEDKDITVLRPLVAEELASNGIDWWVLVSDAETLIGFLGFKTDTIEALFIEPDNLRQGAGKFLVTHAQSLTSNLLAVEVNEQNESALQFYKAMGFLVVKRSPTDLEGRPFPILHMKRGALATT